MALLILSSFKLFVLLLKLITSDPYSKVNNQIVAMIFIMRVQKLDEKFVLNFSKNYLITIFKILKELNKRGLFQILWAKNIRC